eukprot:CAMPEP_0185480408 /NCGR_PEP_ID=MMETSP1366-20130426/6236_1 /TAXON_ID=38817 /ORGANISM="Gephyrocapsa oceanica, Strain RCC1303" /LENGTH=377 /DNA_ID=CAMNT_0028087955 /DNA_START=21 /DNA_END=1154 /DNA_ORIENTATION=+
MNGTAGDAPSPPADVETDTRQLIGVCLALSGNLLVSVALNITKHAHNLNQRAATPQPYVKLPLWWTGFVSTIVGELGNFAAYGFADASVIAPLGAISVLSNAFIAALVLGEGLRCRDLIGCCLCIAGGAVIVASCSTHDLQVDADVHSFLSRLQDRIFLVYMLCLTILTGLMLGFQDKYGHAHVGYYVLLCSMLGSVTVMACKGVSTMLNLWICCGGSLPVQEPVFYLALLVLGSTAVLQIRYLNIAMENFGNTETVPVFYVMFTLCTILGSNFLYHDFEHKSTADIGAFCAGCCLTFGGVKLLTSKRDRHKTPPDALLASEAPGEWQQTSAELTPPSLAGTTRSGALQPMALMNTPLGFSGDVIRRTITNRGDPAG